MSTHPESAKNPFVAVAEGLSASSVTAFGPLLAQACEYLPHGLAVADPAFRLLFSNKHFNALLPHDAVLGELPALRDVLAGCCDADGPEGGPDAFMPRLEDGATVTVLAQGRPVVLLSRALPNGCHLVTAEDGAERSAPKSAALLGAHDPLTGLPNRVVLRDCLAQAAGIAEPGRETAVLCLDLDRFKTVNDSHGHPVGDQLLKRVAERLLSVAGPGDTVARFGGDEFAIVQTGAVQPAGAQALAGRLVDLIGRAYLLGDNLVNIGVSIGIAIAPGDGTDPDDLLRNADLALYRAKEGGRGQFRVFEPEMQARMQTRRALEFDLRRALGMREFELFYQPQFNFDRNRVEGFEALLRWRHPKRGLVSPADFIPIVEELGLIIPIGEWALRTACAEAATWPEHMTVAVNLSAVQFTSPRLVSAVVSALAASKLAPNRLELEITESVLLNDTRSTVGVLHELRAMGVQISMDDFGTGYSSLSYLRSFPFDKIKIDQSFVRGMGDSRDCVAIVRAIAGLANALGITTTAEGVETADQRERVRLEGCTSMQGYLVSKPLPAADIKALLRSDASAA